MSVSRDRPQMSREERRNRLVALIAIASGCILALGLFMMVGYATRLRPLPDLTLADISGSTGLEFPASARLVDAYGEKAIMMDYTLYYRVRIGRSEIEEFMQQKLLRGKWDRRDDDFVNELLNDPDLPSELRNHFTRTVAESLPTTLKRRWREIFSAKDCHSSGAALGEGPHSMRITGCLDDRGDPNVSTVYIQDAYW